MNEVDRNSSGELLRVGDLLADGKYEVLALVGSGGMGQVYRARHTVLRRIVAIKVLHPGMTADPKVEARFLREARATSLLEHRNSMQVLDFGAEKREDGSRLLYIVMEFIEGRELSDVLGESGPLGTARIAELAAQTCAALFQAHEQGVIHRDLKPENIMIVDHVDDDGRPVERIKVCDFGIAKIQSSEEYDSGKGSKLTEAGEVFGTPFYMSPEQARGKKLDARSDIYSLGVVLFELATGKLPFVGENVMGILTQQITDQPPHPSEINPAVDPALEQVILRCLEKDPDRRYQSVRDLRRELLMMSGSRDIPSPSLLEAAPTVRASTPTAAVSAMAETAPLELSETPPTATPAAKPGRSGLWIALAVLLVGGGGVGAYVYLSSEPEPADEPETVSRAHDEGAKPVQPRVEPEPSASAKTSAGSSSSNVEEPEPTPEPEPEAEPEPEPEPEQAGTSASKAGKKKKKKKPKGATGAVEEAAPEPDPSASAEATAGSSSSKDETPAPAPTPEPAPVVETPKPEPVPAPKLEASVSASVVSVQGSLPQGPIKRGLKRVVDDYRACYRKAARSAGRDWSGKVNVGFIIDVDGRARSASASGGGLPGLDGCVRSASSRIRSSSRPDTGTVKVQVSVRFTPKT